MHTFYGLSFLYVVLPVAVAIFLLSPQRWRPFVLMLLSLGYYLLAQPREILFFVCCVVMDWSALLVMDRYENTPSVRKLCLAFSAVKAIGVIFWMEELLRTGRLAETPLGLQIYALSGLWCVVQVYRREAPSAVSPVSLAVYCGFFPRLYAGPMLPYSQFAPQMKNLSPSLSGLGSGASLFIQGAVKTGILGVELLALYDILRAMPVEDHSVAGAWCTVLVLALSIYYQYSGYSSMARGIAAMMGIALPRNFYYPYQAQSITDFIDRFNIGIGRLWQDILPQTEKTLLQILRTLAAGVAMGCFFGLRANFIAWGFYLSVFVVLERYAYPNLIKYAPVFFRRCYSLFIVLCGFVLFSAESLSGVGETFSALFGSSGLALVSGRLAYNLSSHWLLLTVSILLATSIASLLVTTLRSAFPRVMRVATGVGSFLLLLVLTAFSFQ